MLHPVLDLKATAWDGKSDDEGARLSVPTYALEDMLQRVFDFDAFAVGYCVLDPDGEPMESLPRLTNRKSKKAISDIREEGGNVYMSTVFIDLDRQPHDPWPLNKMEEVQGYVEDLAVMLPEAAIYATKRGLRVVFKLRRFVAIENYRKIAKAAMRYVENAVKRVGVPVTIDATAEEWDRLARLPFVRRDGRITGEYTFLHMPEVLVGWFPGASLVKESEREMEALAAAAYENADRPQGIPDVTERTEEVLADLAISGPPFVRTPAKLLLDNKVFFSPGDRNQKTWQVMRALYRTMRTRGHIPTPEDMYAVFYWSVSESTGTSPEEALEETWGMAERLYGRQIAALEVSKKERESALSVAQDRTPAVVYMNKGRWIWNPERATYGQATTDNNTFLAEITRHHPLDTLDDKGKPLPMASILRDLGVRAHGTKQILGQTGARLNPDPHGRMWLEVGVGEIVPVKPVFHAHVQEYLDVIKAESGEGEGDLLLEWLATSTQLSEPTTALVLRGASGAGKDMIAEALARLFGGKAAFSKSMQQFNSQMLDSALIHLNEGVDDKDKGGPVANRFREIVAGGSIDIEQKGVDPTMIIGNYRVLITTNNPQPLPVQNTKTLDDFRAIAKRVLHVWMDQRVADWLEERGGRTYTDDWVDRDLGDRTEPGDLVEHIAWLVQNHKVRSYNSRFLVPANVGPWHVRSLLQGILRDVTYAAGLASTSEAYLNTVQVVDGQVWVTDNASFANIVNKLNGAAHEAREIKEAIRGSLIDGRPRRLAVGAGTQVFYPMPMDLILPVMRPEDPEIYIEEADTYQRLLDAIKESVA